MTAPTQTEKKRRTRGEVIRALMRMADGANERGFYSFDRLDAAWAEAAIDLLVEGDEHDDAQISVVTDILE